MENNPQMVDDRAFFERPELVLQLNTATLNDGKKAGAKRILYF